MKQFTCIFDTIPHPRTVVSDLGTRIGMGKWKMGQHWPVGGLIKWFPQPDNHPSWLDNWQA